ncbi:MAG: hypothetical protein JWR10_3637 [Rubritepida sp.]|nr:hypothetical protein [Rubritepida sp.]
MQPAYARWQIRAGNTEVATWIVSDPATGEALDLTVYEARLSIAWAGGAGIYWRTGVDAELVLGDQTEGSLTRGWITATLSPALSRSFPTDVPVLGELELRAAGIEDSLIDIEFDISTGSNHDG